MRAVEGALVALGYPLPPKAGDGGAATLGLDDAIRRLQTHHGLKPDGIVESHGPTATRMGALLAARRVAPPTPPPGPLSFPSRTAGTLLDNLEPALPSGHMRVIRRPKPELGPSPLAGWRCLFFEDCALVRRLGYTFVLQSIGADAIVELPFVRYQPDCFHFRTVERPISEA